MKQRNPSHHNLKVQHNRGLRIQNRIIISVLLVLLQLAFLLYMAFEASLYSVWGFTISNLVGAITAVYIINKRGNPDHKIVWIIFILILPIFGISVYVLWGGGRVLPHSHKKMAACNARYMPYLKGSENANEKLKY